MATMRRIGLYIHLVNTWPEFTWDANTILLPLSEVRYKQGNLLGKIERLGFKNKIEATLDNLTLDVIKSSEIEGEKLPIDQVRSSIARRLGLEFGGDLKISRNVEGVVEMMLDATQNFNEPLSFERLFGWHAALFPTGRSGIIKILVGKWRDDSTGPMQIVSGAMGKVRIHFEAPAASRLEYEMQKFIEWFNNPPNSDLVLNAAIAHFWFVTLHPFDDGNGRIARALADMQLAKADGTKQRFYSMSAQIQKERSDYYKVLEKCQKGNLDITKWFIWFLNCLDKSIASSDENLSIVFSKNSFWNTFKSVSLNARQIKTINKIMDHFEGNLTSSKWAKINKCSLDTALRDIQDLIEKNILRKNDGGGRSTSYQINI